MKSSIVPYAAGAMTVLGVWLFASNKQKIDKLVKNVSETMDQMLQKAKKRYKKIAALVTINKIKVAILFLKKYKHYCLYLFIFQC